MIPYAIIKSTDIQFQCGIIRDNILLGAGLQCPYGQHGIFYWRYLTGRRIHENWDSIALHADIIN